MKLVSVSPTVTVDPDKIYSIENDVDHDRVEINFDNGYTYVEDATYEQVLKRLGAADNAYIDGGGDDVYGVWA